MLLGLEHFSNAIARLGESQLRCEQEPEDIQLRDGLIQRFEFTYELALKMLRRQLQQDLGTSVPSFVEAIRRGWSDGLLGEELPTWKQFRDHRNLTSHTYDETSTEAVCAVIPRFLAEAKFLLAQLEKRNDDEADD